MLFFSFIELMSFDSSKPIAVCFSPLEHFDIQVKIPSLLNWFAIFGLIFFYFLYTILLDAISLLFFFYNSFYFYCPGNARLTEINLLVYAHTIVHGILCGSHGLDYFRSMFVNYFMLNCIPVYVWTREFFLIDIHLILEVSCIVLPKMWLTCLWNIWYSFKFIGVHLYVNYFWYSLALNELKYDCARFYPDLFVYLYVAQNKAYSFFLLLVGINIGLIIFFFLVLDFFFTFFIDVKELQNFFNKPITRFCIKAVKLFLSIYNAIYFWYDSSEYFMYLTRDLDISSFFLTLWEQFIYSMLIIITQYIILILIIFYSVCLPDFYLLVALFFNVYYIILNILFVDYWYDLYLPKEPMSGFGYVLLGFNISFCRMIQLQLLRTVLEQVLLLTCSVSSFSLGFDNLKQFFGGFEVIPSATDYNPNSVITYALITHLGTLSDFNCFFNFIHDIYTATIGHVIFMSFMYSGAIFFYIVYYSVVWADTCGNIVDSFNNTYYVTPTTVRNFVNYWPRTFIKFFNLKNLKHFLGLYVNNFATLFVLEIVLFLLFALLIQKKSQKLFNVKEFNYYTLVILSIKKTLTFFYFSQYYNSQSNLLNSFFKKPLREGFFSGVVFYNEISDKFLFLLYKIPYLLIKDQFYNKYYFPFYLVLFYYIIINNLLSLFPASFSLTGQLVVSLTLSCTYFIGLNIIALLMYGVSFYKFFVPKNVPYLLLWLLIVIEVFSYYSRCLSLGIRLFANLMAGHTLLNILISFSNYFFYLNKFVPLFIVLFILPLFIFVVFLLEVGIAFLQAYVFVMLALLYAKDIFNFKHCKH